MNVVPSASGSEVRRGGRSVTGPMTIEDKQVLTKGQVSCEAHGWVYGIPKWETGRNARDRLMRAAKRHSAHCDATVTISVERKVTLSVVTDGSDATDSELAS